VAQRATDSTSDANPATRKAIFVRWKGDNPAPSDVARFGEIVDMGVLLLVGGSCDAQRPGAATHSLDD
jgi:hypothetical protein